MRKLKPENIVKAADHILSDVEQVADTAERHFERTIDPFRKNVLKRFPILFLLMVTFGVTATITGMEQLLLKHGVLQENPTIILCLGIGALVFTGTLYKKLG
jgi:hypothetical protein